MAAAKRFSLKMVRKLVSLGALAAIAAVIALYSSELRDYLVDDTRYAPEIAAAAARHGVDAKLVRAVIFVESRFRADTVGKAGEIGLMQLLPAGAVADWARENGRPAPGPKELRDVGLNLEIGCRYLGRGLQRYRGEPRQVELALCFYNAGPSRADNWRTAARAAGEDVMKHMAIESTADYVGKVMKRYELYRRMEEEP